MTTPRAVAIVGPTASGKSGLALALAERFDRSILCCDSVQVYRKLDIGSAKPSAEERRRVPHELLDLVEPDQEFSAGEYGRLAREQLELGPAIFCGGTGLYLRAAGWTHSSDGGARIDDHGPERERFEQLWMNREAGEPGAVHRALSERDPETAAEIHPQNVVRALRALWLCELHQEPISAVRKRDPPRPLLDILMIVLDPGVAAVDAAIERRCEAMLTRGWVAEVENLVADGYDARHKAMRSLGYRELLDHITGKSSLEQSTRAIKQATKKYARRQRTYFRHQFRTLLAMDRIVHIEHPAAAPVARVAEFLQ
ncbi:MAG TPA: tRNA (adenosine(37)-N6)-dimethylallyltransferase MiaA [Enhygromyxa sp.]|nr:tRNA (adenosine(37)-N6)-dimethylallyltransferase MiaA [Enhygromyxa sp.]